MRGIMKKKAETKLLSNTEIAFFCGQMSMMMSAGITVSEALHLLQEDTENTQGKDFIFSMAKMLDSGNSFYESLLDSGVFPKYVLDMIHIGEQTGNLDEVFSSLASYYEREENISKGIRSAVTYPFIMIAMMLCVILVLIVKVLPVFEQVFEQLGSSMTGLSASILHLGRNISNYSALFVILFGIMVLLYLFFTHSPSGREKLRDFAAGFPLTKDLYSSIAAGRFSSGMALALRSGFHTEEGLLMVKELITNKHYLKKIDACHEYMKSGENFSEAVIHANIFSGTYGRMVHIGFKSGKLDEIMAKIALQYENDVDYKINHFVSILEPTLVAILSVVVGMILLSVMLPLMGVMSSIG